MRKIFNSKLLIDENSYVDILSLKYTLLSIRQIILKKRKVNGVHTYMEMCISKHRRSFGVFIAALKYATSTCSLNLIISLALPRSLIHIFPTISHE